MVTTERGDGPAVQNPRGFSLRTVMRRGKPVKLKPLSLPVKDRRKILKVVPKLRKIKPAKPER